jgi:hypothetical protein
MCTVFSLFPFVTLFEVWAIWSHCLNSAPPDRLWAYKRSHEREKKVKIIIRCEENRMKEQEFE